MPLMKYIANSRAAYQCYCTSAEVLAHCILTKTLTAHRNTLVLLINHIVPC